VKVNVGLAQIYPKLGDVRANLTKHLEYIERARAAGVDLLIFPELSMTGYDVRDLVSEVALRPTRDDDVFRALLDASRHLDLVFGFVSQDERHRYYISGAYLSGGEVLHIHHKVYLWTYTMAEDARFFAPGDQVRAFDTRFGRVGLLVCEDFWHMSLPYLLWVDGADLFIFHSSSPSRGLDNGDQLSVARFVEQLNLAYASSYTNYVLHCNRVGYEDGRNYWGGSSIATPEGEFLKHGLYFDEALITQTIDLNQIHRTRSRLPLLRDERPLLIQRELGRILERQSQIERR
jgi:NAD+ synthase (glutamine-hydrolysing)